MVRRPCVRPDALLVRSADRRRRGDLGRPRGRPRAIRSRSRFRTRTAGRLKAVLFRPGGPGPVPGGDRPAQLHRPEQPLRRAWARAIAIGASGSPRAASSCCSPTATARAGSAANAALRKRSLRVERERVADANAARVWLQQQPWVVADRISLHRLVERRDRRAVGGARAAPPAKDGPDFRSAVALYPGCRRLGHHRLERAGADADPDRPRRRPGVGRGLPADGGGRARPQRAGRDPRLSRRAPRFRPSRTGRCRCAPAIAFSVDGSGRVPQRHRSGRARRRAQARAGVAGAVGLDFVSPRRRCTTVIPVQRVGYAVFDRASMARAVEACGIPRLRSAILSAKTVPDGRAAPQAQTRSCRTGYLD